MEECLILGPKKERIQDESGATCSARKQGNVQKTKT